MADANNTDQNDEPSGRRRRTARAVQRYGYVDDDPDNPDSGPDMRDSDDDPEFNAGGERANGTGSEDEEPGSVSASRGGRGSGRGRKRKSSVPNEVPPAKIQATGTARRGRPASSVTSNTVVKTPNKDGASSSSSSGNTGSSTGPNRITSAATPYKSGDYLIAKNDIPEFRSGLNPPIWRVDGKSLLQKFNHFEKEGRIQYKNVPTYSGWTPASYHQYTGVKTKFIFQSKKDTTVELIDVIENADQAPPPPERPKEIKVWSNPIESRDYEIPDEMKLNEKAFKIYIQALISNALDTTILKDVYDENDDYFPPAIRKIENQGTLRRNKLLEISTWSAVYKRAIDTWPCINIKNEANESCSACGSQKATKLVQFYGRSYDNDSLADRPAEKGLRMRWELCERCGVITSLYNKIAHLKYEHYDQCKSQVTNMLVLYPEEDTRVVEELLEHQEWLSKLFKMMCQHNVRADKFYAAEKDRLSREKSG